MPFVSTGFPRGTLSATILSSFACVCAPHERGDRSNRRRLIYNERRETRVHGPIVRARAYRNRADLQPRHARPRSIIIYVVRTRGVFYTALRDTRQYIEENTTTKDDRK